MVDQLSYIANFSKYLSFYINSVEDRKMSFDNLLKIYNAELNSKSKNFVYSNIELKIELLKQYSDKIYNIDITVFKTGIQDYIKDHINDVDTELRLLVDLISNLGDKEYTKIIK